jgi:hypothetical protein
MVPMGGEQTYRVARKRLSIDARSWFVRILKVEPGLDALRSHARFQNLLARAWTSGPDRDSRPA